MDWNKVEDGLISINETERQLEIWTVVGFNHRSSRPNRPGHSWLAISDKSRLITRCDKRFCSHSEITDWYSAGHHARVFSVDDFRMGCALNIEIQFPEVFGQYEQLDADCFVFSALSDDPMFWTQAQGHAATNNLWVSVTTPAQFGTTLQGWPIGPAWIWFSGLCEAKMTAQLLRVELDKKSPDLHVVVTKARPSRRKARTQDIYKSDTKSAIAPACPKITKLRPKWGVDHLQATAANDKIPFSKLRCSSSPSPSGSGLRAFTVQRPDGRQNGNNNTDPAHHIHFARSQHSREPDHRLRTRLNSL